MEARADDRESRRVMEIPPWYAAAEDALREWALSEPLVRRVCIYGSRVKGSQNLTSDFDVAVEIDPAEQDSESWKTWILKSDDWERAVIRALSARSPLLAERLHLQHYKVDSHVHLGIQECSVTVYERATSPDQF
jgi:predicted nucleotidyltransferase